MKSASKISILIHALDTSESALHLEKSGLHMGRRALATVQKLLLQRIIENKGTWLLLEQLELNGF